MMQKIARLAMAGALIFCAFPQVSHAEKAFEGRDFLTWERKNQISYLHTSVGMAGLIVGQNNKTQGECIDDWYFADEQKSVDFMLDAMRQYPYYHPRGIILAVLEKKCGKFIYTQ